MSLSALLLRLATEQQPGEGCAQFYKMLLKALSLFIAASIAYNGVGAYVQASKQMGAHFLVGAGALGLYYMFENWAVVHTTVGNADVLKQLSPCWSAILGILVFAEKPPAMTLLAVLMSVISACIIFVGSRRVNEERPETLAGDLAALLSSFFLASYFIVVNDAARHFPAKNMVGCTSLASLIAALPFLFEAHWSVGSYCWPTDGILGWRWTLLSGAVVAPLSIAMLTLGSKYCSATVVSLMCVMDGALAPLWAWIALDEVPNTCTMVGGTMLLTTLAIHEFVLYMEEEGPDMKKEEAVESERTPLMPEQRP